MSIKNSHKITVVIPTLNAANEWAYLMPNLLSCVSPKDLLILDSSSTDGTTDLARAAGERVHIILRSEFNHGGSRQLAVELSPTSDFLIFMTQDAILVDSDSVEKLLEPFSDPNIAAAFGRQLPKPGAGPVEAHARFFNYPEESSIRTLDSRKELGFKAIFISNSFAAYRRTALIAVGGFPTSIIFGEDTVTAARFLLSGWKIAYVADAQVYHSHSYTWSQEFRRYFDIGVLHSREKWLVREFGATGKEGLRFFGSEVSSLWPHFWWMLPSVLIRTALKFAGYRLGKVERKMSIQLKKNLSFYSDFWK